MKNKHAPWFPTTLESHTQAFDMLDMSQFHKMSITKCKVAKNPEKTKLACQVQVDQKRRIARQNMPNCFKTCLTS